MCVCVWQLLLLLQQQLLGCVPVCSALCAIPCVRCFSLVCFLGVKKPYATAGLEVHCGSAAMPSTCSASLQRCLDFLVLISPRCRGMRFLRWTFTTRVA